MAKADYKTADEYRAILPPEHSMQATLKIIVGILWLPLLLAGCLSGQGGGRLSVDGPHPQEMTVMVGESAAFNVHAYCGEPCGTFLYQWKKDGVDLVDGPTGTGSFTYEVTTATLRVQNAQLSDSGSYACFVRYPSLPDSMLSDAAILKVTVAP